MTYLEGKRVTLDVCVLFVFFSIDVNPFDSSILSRSKQIISARMRGESLSLEKKGSENVTREHSTRRSRNLKKVKYVPIIYGRLSIEMSTALFFELRDLVKMSRPVGVYIATCLDSSTKILYAAAFVTMPGQISKSFRKSKSAFWLSLRRIYSL